MRVRLVGLEDGLMSCGFRRMAAFAERLNPDTHIHYVSTQHYSSAAYLMGTHGGKGIATAESIDEIAQGLLDADVIGFSSMTGYAELTRKIISRVREISNHPFIIWGGIHPIIHPEDAISAPGADAVCTGEGEFAFDEFLKSFEAGKDFSATKNFWFTRGDKIVRNSFRPLMTNEEMETLPPSKYGGSEWIYKRGRGFIPVRRADYLKGMGLAYNVVWSIGCPFRCTYCGNTKFIDNDRNYRKIRHPSAEFVVEDVKAARKAIPHISSVVFHDDSFMAIPYAQLHRFAELWKNELDLPFCVTGVIPNYVARDKIEVLTWAGMNRIRMGIQSGSQRILDFYDRRTPVKRIEAAAEINASFAPRYHIPPAYDIICDNPIEERKDVIDTLELLYRMRRPFTLNIFSLKVIPNTDLEKAMTERGIDIDAISENYNAISARWGNLMLYVLAIWRPPRRIFDWMLKRVEASAAPQRMYPTLNLTLRAVYLVVRGVQHIRHMDFSTITGGLGYAFWKIGLVSFWCKWLRPRPPRPDGAGRRNKGPSEGLITRNSVPSGHTAGESSR